MLPAHDTVPYAVGIGLLVRIIMGYMGPDEIIQGC